MSVEHAPSDGRKRWARRPRGWATMAMAVAALALLCASGALMGVRLLARAQPPHSVLDVRFAGSIGGAQRAQFELWADTTAQRARLLIAPDQPPLYYVRDGAGAWYAIGRPSARAPWQRTRLAAGQEPSLLTMQGLRAYFARLRARAAGSAVPVDLHQRLAYAFTAPGLTWPFPDAGPTTVWLDGLTGLPLQFRDRLGAGANESETITTVESIRVRVSSALPADFFTPPGQNRASWADALRRVTSWLQGIVARLRGLIGETTGFAAVFRPLDNSTA